MSRKKKSKPAFSAKSNPRGTTSTAWDPWIVLALSLLVYCNTLGNELVWDDQVVIVQNPLVSSMNIRGIFSTAYWYPDPKLTDLYRPITVLSFALNHKIGGLAPFVYHLTNVILHGINSLLVFLLLTKLTRSRSLSLGAALIFALHPVHSEAVAWVSGRAELLACCFMLSTWWVTLASGPESPERTRRGAWWLHAGSAAVLYLFALLSKESALVLLPVVWIFRAVSFQSSHAKETSSLSWKKIVRPIDVALAGAALCMIGLRIAMLGQAGPKTANTVPYVENPLAFSSTTTRVLTAIKLLGLYFWKMVWPLHLSSDYSFNQIPAATLGDSLFWMALALLLLCLALALRAGLSSWILGGIWTTCAGFSMVLNLFFPTGTLFAERLAYFPLLGFSVAMAALIDHPRLRRFFSLPGPVLLASVLVVFFVRTYERNRDWKDNHTVFAAMARTAPGSAKAQTLAGLSRAEQPSLSRQNFQKALEIYPEYLQAKLGLAQAEINLKNYGKAEELLKEILSQDQNSREALQALAIAYRGTGKFNLALETSDKALVLHPDDPLAMTEKAIALEGLKRDSEAIAAFQKAIAAGADNAEVRNRLGTIYLGQKDLQAALEQFTQASRLQPSDPLSYFNLGDVYRQMGDKAAERQAYLDFLRYWRGNPRVAATIRNRLEALH